MSSPIIAYAHLRSAGLYCRRPAFDAERLQKATSWGTIQLHVLEMHVRLPKAHILRAVRDRALQGLTNGWQMPGEQRKATSIVRRSRRSTLSAEDVADADCKG